MPYHSYPRQGDRIAELLLMGGQQQAENAARLGETISSGLAGVGEQISGYYQAQGQRKREQAFSEFVRSGAWAQNPRIALAESLRFFGPEKGPEVAKGLISFTQLEQNITQQNLEANKNRLGFALGVLEHMSDEAIAEGWD